MWRVVGGIISTYTIHQPAGVIEVDTVWDGRGSSHNVVHLMHAGTSGGECALVEQAGDEAE